MRFSWLNTPFIFFFSTEKADRKNKNKYDLKMKLGITVGFQDHKFGKRLRVYILGWILKNL